MTHLQRLQRRTLYDSRESRSVTKVTLVDSPGFPFWRKDETEALASHWSYILFGFDCKPRCRERRPPSPDCGQL